jgi:hypothetical protein
LIIFGPIWLNRIKVQVGDTAMFNRITGAGNKKNIGKGNGLTSLTNKMTQDE